MRKLLRVIALLMAVVCLGGCSVIHEDHDLSGLELPEPEYIETGTTTRRINPSLYFLKETGSKLGVETREIILGQEEDEATAILEALLDTPERSELSRLASGLSLDKVVRTGELMNVYLYATNILNQQKKFIVSAAVTNTLVDYFNISYVCVFINGEPLTIDGYPYGAMQKISENVRDAYHEYQAKSKAQQCLEILVPIYFLDETGEYILPEMRTLSIDKNEEEDSLTEQLVTSLLAELSAGPKVQYNLQTSLAQQSNERDSVWIVYHEAVQYMELRYNYRPMAEGWSFSAQACASVFYTIAGVQPSLQRLSIRYAGMTDTITRSIAQIYVGDRITLYFPDEEKNSLVSVSRTVSSSDRYRYDIYLRELLRGPLDTDREDAAACFPQEADSSCFRTIRVLGNTAYVDFTENFREVVEGMNEKGEYMLIYAIVNTLCNISRVKQVQFTINGETVRTAGGELCLAYPLLPNPGLLN